MNRSITIKDVAKEAGVSTATVSRVLNGNGYVSARARDSVVQSIGKLNYQPNAIARSLKQERTGSIGIVLPDMTNPFFMSVSRTLQEQLLAEGFHLLYMDSDNEPAKEKEALNILLEKRAEAIILAGTGENRGQLRQIRESGVPVVLIDRQIAGFDSDLVIEDSRSAARQAVAYLLRAGHRRFAMINGPRSISTATERFEGVREALLEAGIPLEEPYLVQGDYKRESGLAGIERLMKLSDPPTAVFSANNEMTFGLYLGLREMGKPLDDIEVVSFGDLEFSSLFRHRLSAIVQDPASIGRAAGELVLKRLKDGSKSLEKRIFTTRFVCKT